MKNGKDNIIIIGLHASTNSFHFNSVEPYFSSPNLINIPHRRSVLDTTMKKAIWKKKSLHDNYDKILLCLASSPEAPQMLAFVTYGT